MQSGASGESKRDVDEAGKPPFAHEALSLTNIDEEVNNLTVKSEAHDVDIGSDDLRTLERQREEEPQSTTYSSGVPDVPHKIA